MKRTRFLWEWDSTLQRWRSIRMIRASESVMAVLQKANENFPTRQHCIRVRMPNFNPVGKVEPIPALPPAPGPKAFRALFELAPEQPPEQPFAIRALKEAAAFYEKCKADPTSCETRAMQNATDWLISIALAAAKALP